MEGNVQRWQADDADREGCAMNMVHGRNPALLALLRQHALTPLAEMARWKSDHALAAFWVLGCLAGFSDQEIFADWNRGERGRVIQAALRH